MNILCGFAIMHNQSCSTGCIRDNNSGDVSPIWKARAALAGCYVSDNPLEECHLAGSTLLPYTLFFLYPPCGMC